MPMATRPKLEDERGLFDRLGELRVFLELGSLGPALPALLRAPHGDGHPVLVLPGMLASDGSTFILRRYLKALGYQVHPWKLGRNWGPSTEIRQGIRDSERDQMMQEFKGRHQELVSALVERVDPKTGALSLKIGKAEAILPKGEQVGTENVKEGDHVQVYVVDVKETEKGPKAIISRTHPDLIRRLFEKEVPEIFDGTVEIKAVAREAGSRTKIAVMSHNPDVDAVGACIGTRGTRVSDIVNELGGEKMDIVDYSEDPAKFIAAALAPATVLSVETAEDGSHVCKVTVPDSQLSLAIGNKGQNARLAAKLTGWKIDIKPESGFFGEEEEA